MKELMLGYRVEASDQSTCLSDIVKHILTAKSPAWLACLNPHSYAVALEDKTFKQALQVADWLVPDGIGMVYASHLLGGQIKNRITGSDVFFGVHELLNVQGSKVFFLGTSKVTLATICERMARDYPRIIVAGTYSPPFKPSFNQADNSAMCSAINAVKPDVLWIGMTAPKQEKWIAENLHRLDVRFIGAIGAVFDFYSGKVNRSHPVFQRFGLEWLPRLLQQPRRLWKRMFVSAPIFIFDVFRYKLLKKV